MSIVDYKFIIDYDDLRFSWLYGDLLKMGYSVSLYTHGKNITSDKQLVFVFSPKRVLTVEFLAMLPRFSIIFASSCDNDCKKLLALDKSKLFLYKDDPVFMYQNAKITAYGAINNLIINTDLLLDECTTLILGGGRLAKALANILAPLSIPTHASSNNQEELGYLSTLLSTVYTLDALPHYIANYDAIINTIPLPVIPLDLYKLIKQDAVLIDLASPPYGLDKKIANKHHLKVNILSGLPATTAPKTASDLIMRTVFERLCILRY